MRLQDAQQTTKKRFSPSMSDVVRVGGRYRVGKLLGTGGSGSVYLGKDIMTGADVALKIGHPCSSLPSRLSHEHNVYATIAGGKGISQVLWYGKEGVYEVIVLDHLGTSLGDLIDQPKFDRKKTFLYATQMLSAVQSVHDQHYIHRDIKPGNFMIRGDSTPTVFVIDFGLAQLFRNPATYLHIPFTTNHSIVGTLPFTSINGHQSNSQSRRDDLESLAYTIIYSALGDLPWIGNSTGSNVEAVLRKKTSITAEELCKGLPAPFCKFVTYVRSLSFEEKPDYRYLHSILLQCSETVTGQHVKALPLYTSPHVSVDRASPVFPGRVLRSSTRAIAESPLYTCQTPVRAAHRRSKR